ncbi:MAG: PilZ domain-containing protein [Desulfobacterales bacterium]|nr:PilZ domain-containing protein [Desulfobacterales bacterium]
MWFLKKKAPEEHTEIPFERRKFERIRNILTILAKRDEDFESFKLFTDNVSEGGFKAVTQIKIEPGESLQLIILLHSIHTSINAHGKVAWINPLGSQQFETGIEFMHLDAADQRKFKEYIERYRTCVTKGGP